MVTLEKGNDFLAESKRQLNRAEQRFLKLNMLKIKIERYNNERELNTTLFSINEKNSDFIVNQLESENKKNEIILLYNRQIEMISKNVSISLLYLLEIFYSISTDTLEKDLTLRIESKDVFFKVIEFIDRDELQQKLDLKILIPRIIQFEFYLAGKELNDKSYDSIIVSRIERIKKRAFR